MTYPRHSTNEMKHYQAKMGRNLRVDIKGQRFGMLTVIDLVPWDDRGSTGKGSQWLCKCDCGKTCVKVGRLLRYGQTKSCGCLRTENYKNLTDGKPTEDVGARFGMLVVTGLSDRKGQGKYFDCKCDCGGSTTVRSKELRNGTTKSCGCLCRAVRVKNAGMFCASAVLSKEAA